MYDAAQSELISRASTDLDDREIQCIDCKEGFVWTSGEQLFFRDKNLENPPKRCKPCKKAKNQRLEAIELGKALGKLHRIEVAVNCVECKESTTVPFYPSQGRPVYCRKCFQSNGHGSSNSVSRGV